MPACPRRIVHDERVEMRHRAHHDLWKAGFRQGQGLPGQPFQVAVFAEMDDRVRAEFGAQPGVEGQVVVRGYQIRRVVGLGRIDVVATGRLDADNYVAKTQDRKCECSVRDEGSSWGFPQRSSIATRTSQVRSL